MSSQDPRAASGTPSCAPPTLPLAAGNPLSWKLGRRAVADAPLCFALEHARSARTCEVYAATDETVVAVLRSPVGRERHYELRRESLPDTVADSEWTRTA